MQTAIRATLIRGGTSRGLYFRSDDLPEDVPTRDRVLLAAMGSPDSRQIDGIGGAHPLTSKVAILSKPSRPDADIDYLFLQVSVDRAEVSDVQNCGNILAGVGPWAIENGYVDAQSDTTDVRIHMVNSGGMAVASVATPAGQVAVEGQTRIDGVPGTASAIPLNFVDVAGSSCGSLLPTGQARDHINGIDVTCIDNGMPVVLIKASDLGKTGYESPAELESDTELKSRIEDLRLAIGTAMNLGDVRKKTVPKMCLIAPPADGGVVTTRSFIPHRVHEAIGVLGAVSVATACVIDGTVASGVAQVSQTDDMKVEHPTGYFSVAMATEGEGVELSVVRSALLRTARKLFCGEIYIPASIWSP
ncbi:MAG: 4-oxalomesaconate tautomerase [Granulosicoccus sp.]|nr:4-oxalomesaconate tautomerase [Granulosicoccus sp.]